MFEELLESVREGGANEHRMQDVLTTNVVGVLAPAGDETEVFLAAHRRADTGRVHGGLLGSERNFPSPVLRPLLLGGL